jgi:Transglycosylase SLT domain
MASVFGGTTVPAKYQAVVLAAAAAYGMPPAILAAQINAESSWNADAVSPDGAIGISQFLPGTAKSVGLNPRDPVASIKAQAKLMAYYHKQYGSWQTALYAYHDGPGDAHSPGPAGIKYASTILSVAGVQDDASSSTGTDIVPVSVDPLSSTEALIDRFADPDAWKRVGYYLLGIALVIAGVIFLVPKPSGLVQSAIATGGKK